MVKARIYITDNDLSPNLKAFPQRLGRAVAALVRYEAPKVESYAKIHAPWTDRSGNARQTLQAVTEHQPLKHSIILSHGMPYGIWLEVKNEGEYAIIEPTIRAMGPIVFEHFNKLLETF